MSVVPFRGQDRTPVDASPGLLEDRMQVIEAELERLQNEWSQAEDELVRASKDVQRHAAPERLRLKRTNPSSRQGGPTAEDLDAMVLNWLWDDHEELMGKQLDAEARCAAFRTIFKCAEKALSSKQSRLKAALELTPRGGRA